MNMRWLTAGIAAVLITGGAATLAQRAITQKTRGVLPDGTEAAHADTRQAAKPVADAPAVALATPPPADLPAVPAPDPMPAAQPTPTAGPIELGSSPPPAPIDLAADPASQFASGTGEAPDPTMTGLPTAVVEPPADPGPGAADPAVNAASADAQAAFRPQSRPAARVEPGENAPTSSAAPAEPAAAKGDPVQSVEEFVERNRKEAEQAIRDLSDEAENLKARLAKVETALVRWHAFSRALNTEPSADQPDAPAPGKANWKKPEALPPAEPAKPAGPPPADPATEPKLEPLPAPRAAEVLPAPTVPPDASPAIPPAEPALPPPADPKPPGPDGAEIPPGLPDPTPEPKPVS